MLKEFREFALKGNVIDLAVAFIMGAAFGKIVTSLVSDIIMPPVGVLMGGVDFSSLFINLSGTAYPSVAAAKEAGAATINYGVFIMTIVDFLIVAFAMFLIIRQINRSKQAEVAAPETTKACPFCFTAVPLQASRCPACTSALETTRTGEGPAPMRPGMA